MRFWLRISPVLKRFGGALIVKVIEILSVAETESVTVKVSTYVPTVAVSEILNTATPAVLVSSVIPGITGFNEYRYVGVPSEIVKVSLRERLIAFLIVVAVAEYCRAGLMTA